MAKKEESRFNFINAAEIKTPPRIPTGVFNLDLALGRGSNGLNGWAINRINLVYGDESGGKTTLVLKALANAQKLCSKCYMPNDRCQCKGGPHKWSILFIDGEHSWTAEWAEAMGIDVSGVDLYYPSSVDDLIDVITAELDKRNIIVIETLAAILSDDELETAEDLMKAVGVKARKMDQAAQKWISTDNFKTTFFIENQVRKNIMHTSFQYLPQDETENLPGGKWQKFYATIIVRVYPSRPIFDKVDEGGVDSKDVIAASYSFEVKKNKVFMKSEKQNFVLSTINTEDYKVGDVMSDEENIREAALKLGIIKRIGDRKLEYGEHTFPYNSAFDEFLRRNPDKKEELKKQIIDMYEKRHSVVILKGGQNE